MCDYCNSFTDYGLAMIDRPYLYVNIVKQPLTNDYYLVTNEYAELPNMRGSYDNSPFRYDKVKINFCPMCGRNLKDVL